MGSPLMSDSVWLQQPRFEQAEAHYHAVLAGTITPGQASESEQGGKSMKSDISAARQQIAQALNQPGNQGAAGGNNVQLQKRIDNLEKENKDLKKTTKDLQLLVQKLESRVSNLEKGGKGDAPAAAPAAAKPAPSDDEDDEDFDPFGDDSDDEEAAKEKEAKKAALIAQYKAKKEKKPAVVAKSSVVFDVKPWDDETDMKEMEKLVRAIQKDGLKWGAGKLVELAYGIKKLTIMCTVEDEKIGVEDLKEEIEEFEDLVQSVDIAAFNKV